MTKQEINKFKEIAETLLDKQEDWYNVVKGYDVMKSNVDFLCWAVGVVLESLQSNKDVIIQESHLAGPVNMMKEKLFILNRYLKIQEEAAKDLYNFIEGVFGKFDELLIDSE